jgi:hypothetical protein
LNWQLHEKCVYEDEDEDENENEDSIVFDNLIQTNKLNKIFLISCKIFNLLMQWLKV